MYRFISVICSLALEVVGNLPPLPLGIVFLAYILEGYEAHWNPMRWSSSWSFVCWFFGPACSYWLYFLGFSCCHVVVDYYVWVWRCHPWFRLMGVWLLWLFWLASWWILLGGVVYSAVSVKMVCRSWWIPTLALCCCFMQFCMLNSWSWLLDLLVALTAVLVCWSLGGFKFGLLLALIVGLLAKNCLWLRWLLVFLFVRLVID